MNPVVLWDYPKSSASYRVRIALNLAGIEYEIKTVDLLEKEHHSAHHLERNPQGLVPVLDIDGHRFTQSLAILDYLDQTRDLGLLPRDPVQRTKVQALAYAIAVDLHPVCNLSVMLQATAGVEPARTQWMQRFIAPGLEAFEALLGQFDQRPFATSDRPSLADICLIPQLYNAKRWGISFCHSSRIRAVEEACFDNPAFQRAAPSSDRIENNLHEGQTKL